MKNEAVISDIITLDGFYEPDIDGLLTTQKYDERFLSCHAQITAY